MSTEYQIISEYIFFGLHFVVYSWGLLPSSYTITIMCDLSNASQILLYSEFGINFIIRLIIMMLELSFRGSQFKF